jgi:hypothetical protein
VILILLVIAAMPEGGDGASAGTSFACRVCEAAMPPS